MSRATARRSPVHQLAAFVYALVALMFGSGPIAAQDRAALSPRLADGWEVWRVDVPVSGDVRVGVMAPGAGQVDPTRITVLLPRTSAALLCVEINSRDGRYSASLEYDVAGLPPGPLPLDVPTRRRDELRAYQQAELAILAGLHAGCDAPAEAFVVATWSGPLPADRFVVFLNSRVPTSVLIGTGGRIEHEVACDDLPGVTTAYNLRCEVSASSVTPESEVFIRQRRGRGFASIPLPILVR